MKVPGSSPPGQLRDGGRNDIPFDRGITIKPAAKQKVEQRTDDDAEPLALAAIAATLAAKQARPDDVEPLEVQSLERLLHLALRPQIEVARAGVGADRGNDDHVARAAGPRRAREIDDQVEIDGTKGSLRPGRAHRRAERRHRDLRAEPAGDLRPIRGRGDMLIPSRCGPPGWTADQHVQFNIAFDAQALGEQRADQSGAADKKDPPRHGR